MPKRKKKKQKANLQSIIDIFNKYLDTTSAILEDNTFTEGARDELSTADRNLLNELNKYEVTITNFNDLVTALGEVDPDDFDMKAVLDACEVANCANPQEENFEEWLNNYADNKGYAIIKLNTLEQRQKVEAFCEQLYPLMNEKENYNL